ncbi:hypothetical protein HPB48_015496 [Haemaphysalis longicornis]|uniref:Uncharacterized protein n=1 Tax=Haemaphysalis longicornis TaxID=44386 RepID=A0A9J6F8Q3_HAELO|nr:hypothetical protein HPB48_015496 [Haemaphysalis longicornis]
MHGQFDFNSPCWNGVSASARQLIQGLLQEDVAQRLTAMQVLMHNWLQLWRHAAAWQREPWQVGLHFQRRRRSSP